jgi:hypothetical protein
MKAMLKSDPGRRGGWMMIELVVALALLLGALLPLAYSIASEKRLFRSTYQRAVAVEIVDGEFEALLAGEWRSYGLGKHAYTVKSAAATNLPPGRFELLVTSNRVRLDWRPELKHNGGSVRREGTLP